MPVVRLADQPPAAWAEFHAADPRATLFLDPLWSGALAAAYPGYRPRWLVLEEKGAPLGMLPLVETARFGLRQVLSLPFGTHGGPLLAPNADPARFAPLLVEAFRARAANPRVVRFEMTVYDPSPETRGAMTARLGRDLTETTTHVIDLTDGYEALWNGRYDRNTRNCVRMCGRAGVRVEVERGDAAVAVLAALHAGQSEGWTGVRPHPAAALSAVCRALGDEARIYVARKDGAPLMASLVLDHPSGESHPWVSGSAAAARPVRAAHGLYDRAIRDAVERGRKAFFFGGSGGNRGIEFFKESFGARAVPVLRAYREAPWLGLVRGKAR